LQNLVFGTQVAPALGVEVSAVSVRDAGEIERAVATLRSTLVLN